MRITILIVLLILNLKSPATNFTNINRTRCFVIENNVDSIFNKYFSILRKQLKKKTLTGNDTKCREEVIHFMEKVTKIKSEIPKGDYNQWSFSKNDLAKWEEWYKANKENIRYDTASKNIYIGTEFRYTVTRMKDW